MKICQLSMWVKQCISSGMTWPQVCTKLKTIYTQEYQLYTTNHTFSTQMMMHKVKPVNTYHQQFENNESGM